MNLLATIVNSPSLSGSGCCLTALGIVVFTVIAAVLNAQRRQVRGG